MKNHRVAVFALDGATFDLIEPWVTQGHLPALQKLLEQGAHARLLSTQPPITGAAWASFQTGVQPGRHGIFDWLTRKEGSYQLTPINSHAIKREVLWEYLSRYNKRVGVIGVPVSYPARPVNGFIITDLLTPDDANYASPLELKAELEKNVGPYPVMPEHWRGRYAARAWLRGLKESLERRLKTALYLMCSRPWDFLMAHFMETDSVQHQMWHLLDGIERPRYHGGNCTGNPILEIYQAADHAVGQLVSELDDDVTVFVISDHGFGPLYYNIYLNCWLFEQGYLALKKNITTLLKRAAWRLGLTPENLYVWAERARLLDLGARMRHGHLHDFLGRAFLSMQNIDWPKTQAYSYGNVGQIYLNLRGREPQGCVEPKITERFVKQIITELKELKNPYTGEPVFERIYRKEEIYAGEELDRAPEILLVSRDGTHCVGTTEFLSHRTVSPTYAGSGWHRMEGIFIASGENIVPGRRQAVQITDLFPMIVSALGLPIPPGLDGRLPAGFFRDEVPVHAQYKRAPTRGPSETASSAQWEQEIRERLRNLGYV